MKNVIKMFLDLYVMTSKTVMKGFLDWYKEMAAMIDTPTSFLKISQLAAYDFSKLNNTVKVKF